ncbi:MAG: S8 family serine peptidase [candidate division KSB1 bacterium]
MKKWWSVFALFLFLMIFSAQAPQTEERPLFVPGEVVVKFKTAARGEVTSSLAKMSLTMSDSVPGNQIFVLKAEPNQDLTQLVQNLQNESNVEYAEPNYLYYASDTPNDPDYNRLWGMNNTGQTGGTADADIDAPEAWAITKGDTSIVVGVIDTGVDYKHPDLAANMWTNQNEDAWADPNDPNTGNGIDDDNNGYVDDWRGWDFANNDNDPFDDNGHGTHVSGTIGGAGNNAVGVVGVNWKVKIMPLKFLTGSGSGSLSAAISAIAYANSFGVNVTNNSWGGGGRSQALEDAIKAAHAANSLFVAAAGNAGTDNDASANYPSNYDVPNVLAVAAIDHKGDRAIWGSGGGGTPGLCGCNGTGGGGANPPGSNYGATTVDLGAPGKDILSTTPNNTYSTFSGTSMATPHVAGIAALTLSKFPDLTDVQLKDKLMRSVDPSPSLQGKTVTGGILNALKAVSN